MALSPHRQLVEAFVAEHCELWAVRSGRMQKAGAWLDLGGARRQKRNADVVLDLECLPDVIGDAQCLPFRDGSFALVTAVEMLYLVADLEAALHEIRRVLQPGGRLVATCPFSRPSNEPGDWRRPTAHAWRWMLKHAGFASSRVDGLGGPYSLLWQAGYVAAGGGGNGFRHAWAPKRALSAFLARTAPLARFFDSRNSASWPLAYGIVAVG